MGYLEIKIKTESGHTAIIQRYAKDLTEAKAIYDKYQPSLGWYKNGYKFSGPL